MPSYGGTAPYPKRYGGNSDATLTGILKSLNAARGTAYDTSEGTNVWVENMAHARAIAAVWGTNQRVANQFNPSRVTSMLSRWEKIEGITPAEGATDNARRTEHARRWARNGSIPTLQSLQDDISALIGPAFGSLTTETVGSARTYWPGGTPNADAPWYSTIARLVIRLRLPTLMTVGEFYDAVSIMTAMLLARVPAWVTWTWYVNASDATKSFMLDDTRNLDNEAFGS